ncbi:DUF6056 family protein [Intrasporangium sp. YIM S08009]|uniref:DUF6056 family protein n=1 Tax=Intrasporangium zincisolvens TaxID=3080018 RepID=UPI002B05F062|nr:DUF6056 family protein [Intrasporangium sp. YIM S08009]
MTTAEAPTGLAGRLGARPSYRSLLTADLPRIAEVVVLALIGVSFLALANLFPYSGDDWAWGSQIGLDRLSTFFADYNGRYAGNLAVLVLTRSSALVAVTMAATVAGISLLVLHLARFRTLTGYALVYALLLSMPAEVWRQGVVWTSGFSNYALATLTMLAVLVALRACLERAPGEWRRPALTAAGLLVLTFVGQLFIEHVTLYLLAMAVLALLVAIRRRRLLLPLWGIVAGTLLGAAAMFSNGAYRRAFTGGNTYQKIGSGSGGRTQQMVSAVETAIAPYGVVLNTTLNTVLLLLVAVLAVHRARRSDGAARVLFALTAVVAGIGTAAVVLLVPRTAAAAATVGPVALVALLATLGLAAVVSDAASRPLVLLVAFSFVVVLLPLLVVTPLGPRCFVPSYVLLLVAVANLAAQAARGFGLWWSATVLVGALALAGTVFVIRFGVYSAIDTASALRQAAAHTAVEQGRTSVTLQHLPGGNLWLHAGDPAFEPWGTRYKLFYGLPDSLRIRVR